MPYNQPYNQLFCCGTRVVLEENFENIEEALIENPCPTLRERAEASWKNTVLINTTGVSSKIVGVQYIPSATVRNAGYAVRYDSDPERNDGDLLLKVDPGSNRNDNDDNSDWDPAVRSDNNDKSDEGNATDNDIIIEDVSEGDEETDNPPLMGRG